MRSGQEDPESGKGTKVGPCCSLDFIPSWVLFHLLLLPSEFFLFHLGVFSFRIFEPLTDPVSIILPLLSVLPFLSHMVPLCRCCHGSFFQLSNFLRSLSQVSLPEVSLGFLKHSQLKSCEGGKVVWRRYIHKTYISIFNGTCKTTTYFEFREKLHALNAVCSKIIFPEICFLLFFPPYENFMLNIKWEIRGKMKGTAAC